MLKQQSANTKDLGENRQGLSLTAPVLATGPYTDLSALIQSQRLGALLPLKRQRKHFSDQSGHHISSQRGRGMEFAEVRPYIAGDDIRNMDWRVTARTGKAHTKLYQEEKERQTFLCCDQSRSLFFGSRKRTKSHCAAQVCALIGWAAIGGQDRVGALLFNDEEERDFRPSVHSKGFLHILSELHRMNQLAGEWRPTPKDWSKQLQHLYRILKPGSQVYWISDQYGFTTDCLHWLSLIRRHCDMSIIIITDPLEHELPIAGTLGLSNGLDRLSLNAQSDAVRNRYKDEMVKHLETMTSSINRLGIPLLSVATDSDVINELRQGLGLLNRSARKP